MYPPDRHIYSSIWGYFAANRTLKKQTKNNNKMPKRDSSVWPNTTAYIVFMFLIDQLIRPQLCR